MEAFRDGKSVLVETFDNPSTDRHAYLRFLLEALLAFQSTIPSAGSAALGCRMILIAKAKGGKSRYVPILPELAQELRTYLGDRTVGYLFETNRHQQYSPRRIQSIVKEIAERAKIKKRVYAHLLRHSVATTLLERGMPIDQIEKFLGHSKLETTQVYAESTTEMIRKSYQLALSE
jgi:site-specific recombinase XerD